MTKKAPGSRNNPCEMSRRGSRCSRRNNRKRDRSGLSSSDGAGMSIQTAAVGSICSEAVIPNRCTQMAAHLERNGLRYVVLRFMFHIVAEDVQLIWYTQFASGIITRHRKPAEQLNVSQH